MSDVWRNTAESRFELRIDDAIAFAAYQQEGDRLVFTHTEVPASLEGQGVGTKLVRGALDMVRAEGSRIVPSCSFVRGFIDHHPEYSDLL